jgi:hypothetical protein
LSADPAIVTALLTELADAPDGMSLPRLCKRLGVRMSVLLRTLAWIGEDDAGGVHGAGWVRTIEDGARTLAVLTDAGRQVLHDTDDPPLSR